MVLQANHSLTKIVHSPWTRPRVSPEERGLLSNTLAWGLCGSALVFDIECVGFP